MHARLAVEAGLDIARLGDLAEVHLDEVAVLGGSGGGGGVGHAALPPPPDARVARWQNLIPSFPWIAPGWRAWGRNPRKGRDQILQRSVAEP